ncbi:YceI family protein [Canibacter zhoujuaniae]|uniref:YceI family protein n=1 Tax=Canibacter zhoujuaniae TaxID=2708343 RepID=UPI0014234C7B|nr:YceI family protein [Canibacter zhoujuaniae]
MAVTAEQIENYEAGTWEIDPVHSEVAFTVRHLGISKVRGNFNEFGGEIVTGEDPKDSTVTATVQVKSVSTGETNRDAHLLNSDFFAADEHPTFEFVGREFQLRDAEHGEITGDLTMRGVTKEVTFEVELTGIGADAYGGTRIGLSAHTNIDRTDFGISFGGAVEKTGQLVVGNKVTISLELQALKK